MPLQWMDPSPRADVDDPPTPRNTLVVSLYIWLLALTAYATLFIFRIVPSWTR